MSSLSHQLTRQWFDQRSSQYINRKYRYTGRRRAEIVKEYLTGSVLEVGTSEKLAGRVHRHCERSTILDISENMLKQTDQGKNMSFVNGDGARLPFADRSFDTVLCSETIYYFEDQEAFITEAYRVLRNKGKLVIVNINSFWFFSMPLWAKGGVVDQEDARFVRNRIPRAGVTKQWMQNNAFQKLRVKGFCALPLKGFEWLDNTFIHHLGFIKIISGEKKS